jgi:DNA mismatch endonuclease (patch repair protein)
MADIMSPAKRSALMAKVKGKNTSLELHVFRSMKAAGLRFRKHDRSLPGSPDAVLPDRKVVIFIDGDFWHGWQFPRWREKLTSFWRKKIETNRARDRRNFEELRRRGWTVIRLWQHQLVHSNTKLTEVLEALADRRSITPRSP